MILVTGATGNVGRHLVRELQDRGVPARAFVRDERKAAEVLPSGVGFEVGDFADPSSVRRALDGLSQVYLASNGPWQREYEGRVVETAMRAGVRRVVKLSSWVDWGTNVWDWAHGRARRACDRTGHSADCAGGIHSYHLNTSSPSPPGLDSPANWLRPKG
jgi:uncharacterized protein YbjT (DUF2867 family)